jgi:histidine ammonia-lyase
MAHVGVALLGYGEVRWGGRILSASDALQTAQQPPLVLVPRTA